MPDHILVDDIIEEMIENLDYLRLSSYISVIKDLEKVDVKFDEKC